MPTDGGTGRDDDADSRFPKFCERAWKPWVILGKVTAKFVAVHAEKFYGIGVQIFMLQGHPPLLWAGWRTARGKITINGIPNLSNYCVIFVLYTYFITVVASCVIQGGRPRLGKHRISGGMTPLVLILGSSRRCVVNFTSRRVKLQKSFRDPFSKASGPISTFWKSETSCFSWDSNLRSCSPEVE